MTELSCIDYMTSHALITWIIIHWSRDWSCTHHVTHQALITWLIMHWLLHMALFHSVLWLNQYSIVYTHHSLFIRSSVDGHLGCFHVLVIVNSAARDIEVCVFFWIIVLIGYMPNSEIAVSFSNCIFKFLRILYPVFHSDCTNLYFHQQWDYLFSTHSHLCYL